MRSNYRCFPIQDLIAAALVGAGAHAIDAPAPAPVPPNPPTKLPARPSAATRAVAPPNKPAAQLDIQSTARTPEAEHRGPTVPNGFEVELVASEQEGIGKFIAAVFDAKGRLWTMTALEYPVDANENPSASAALFANGGRDKVLVYDNVFDPAPARPAQPRVFADHLVMPLGILPYRDAAYVQYGPDIRLYRDTDGDGKADQFDVILTGFGTQDSHLFPHQFARAPGGFILLAQGLFNSSTVVRPNGSAFANGVRQVVFNHCKLARFSHDGSVFESLTAGPNNIWGLTISRDGWPAPWGFRGAPAREPRNFCLANPITSRIQRVTATPHDERFRYEKQPDFLVSDDPWFRPVALAFGPDGCLYVVDWYNKIISHNEVPREHPERDKTRGRSWRIRHRDQPRSKPPDLTRLDHAALLAHLGAPNAAIATLAWQEIVDRQADEIRDKFDRTFAGDQPPPNLFRSFAGSQWGKLHGNAAIEALMDGPALLSVQQARAQAEKFARFRQLANAGGNAATGKDLFEALCLSCHQQGGRGGQIAPPRDGLGRTGVEAMLRNLLTPNAAMEAGYRAYRVETSADELLEGFLVSETPDALVLRLPNLPDQRIPRANIKRSGFRNKSIMPEGLLEALDPAQVRDLFAYLKSLN